MRPKTRKWVALSIFILSLVAWPITATTIFREEPQGILALSWLAISLTALDVFATTDVRDYTDDE